MIWLVLAALLFYPLVVLMVAITGPHSEYERAQAWGETFADQIEAGEHLRAALDARGLEIRSKNDG